MDPNMLEGIIMQFIPQTLFLLFSSHGIRDSKILVDSNSFHNWRVLPVLMCCPPGHSFIFFSYFLVSSTTPLSSNWCPPLHSSTAHLFGECLGATISSATGATTFYVTDILVWYWISIWAEGLCPYFEISVIRAKSLGLSSYSDNCLPLLMLSLFLFLLTNKGSLLSKSCFFLF